MRSEGKWNSQELDPLERLQAHLPHQVTLKWLDQTRRHTRQELELEPQDRQPTEQQHFQSLQQIKPVEQHPTQLQHLRISLLRAKMEQTHLHLWIIRRPELILLPLVLHSVLSPARPIAPAWTAE